MNNLQQGSGRDREETRETARILDTVCLAGSFCLRGKRPVVTSEWLLAHCNVLFILECARELRSRGEERVAGLGRSDGVDLRHTQLGSFRFNSLYLWFFPVLLFLCCDSFYCGLAQIKWRWNGGRRYLWFRFRFFFTFSPDSSLMQMLLA